MGEHFDEISRAVASPMPRRDVIRIAFRVIAGSLATSAFSFLRPAQALAQAPPTPTPTPTPCPSGRTCTGAIGSIPICCPNSTDTCCRLGPIPQCCTVGQACDPTLGCITLTSTPTSTPTRTPTITPTSTNTPTMTPTNTPTNTPTFTPTPSTPVPTLSPGMLALLWLLIAAVALFLLRAL